MRLLEAPEGTTGAEARDALAHFFEWVWPDPDDAPAAPTDASLTDADLHTPTGHERQHP